MDQEPFYDKKSHPTPVSVEETYVTTCLCAKCLPHPNQGKCDKNYLSAFIISMGHYLLYSVANADFTVVVS